MIDAPVYPDVALMLEERKELFRIAAQAALDRSKGGADLDPQDRETALHWASVKPLGRPLSPGGQACAKTLGWRHE